MGAMSDTLENLVLDACLGKADTYAASTLDNPTVWIALFNTAPNDAGGGAEVSGTSYARVSKSNEGETNWNNAVGGLKTNKTIFEFAEAGTGGWGTVTHVGIYNHATNTGGAYLLFHGKLNTSKAVGVGDTFSFGIGDLHITLD